MSHWTKWKIENQMLITFFYLKSSPSKIVWKFDFKKAVVVVDFFSVCSLTRENLEQQKKR